jgi:hypothetical protein
MGALQLGRRAASAFGVYSPDDLGWLCGWGAWLLNFVSARTNKRRHHHGERLLPWEEVGLYTCEPFVVDHVEWWLEKEEAHVRLSEARMRHMLPPMSEEEMLELHKGVYERRFAREFQALRRKRTVCAAVRFVDVL